MKSIITAIKNKEYLEKVALFCKEEKFTHLIAETFGDMSEETFVIMITDDAEAPKKYNLIDTPVCIITADKPSAANTLYLREPFGLPHLRMLLDTLYHGWTLGNYATSLTPMSTAKNFVLDNDYYNIDRIACAITAELALFFTFSDLEKIRVGVSEMITNAIEHGNLGITGDEKMLSTENGTYYDLLSERMNDPEKIKRKTYISFDYNANKLTIKIRDSGEGFDTSKIPDPTDTERLLKLHGRGIFIARMYFDQITYNRSGNEVTLVKFVPNS